MPVWMRWAAVARRRVLGNGTLSPCCVHCATVVLGQDIRSYSFFCADRITLRFDNQ